MTTSLERPRAVAWFPPNWFASVMGTGIVAVAAASLPHQPPGLHTAAVAVWALAAVLLAVVTAITVVHWTRFPEAARSHLDHPVTAPFHGAAPMAFLTVGAGTLLLGRDVVGLPAAVVVDAVLWTVGTAGGLVTAVAIPRRMAAAGHLRADAAFGGWLMPVVPPMVSASTGALLVPHLPAGPARVAFLVGCYLLFAGAAVASAVVVAVVARQLPVRGLGPAASVPTLWIVLGPLGQSVTAVNLLGGVAPDAVPAGTAHWLHDLGLAYGVPVWSVAVVWLVFAAVATARTARVGLPFGLSWWSFTFPVGTVVTGTSALALHTGSAVYAALADVLYAGLVAAWVTVSVRTARAVSHGWLFVPTSR